MNYSKNNTFKKSNKNFRQQKADEGELSLIQGQGL